MNRIELEKLLNLEGLTTVEQIDERKALLIEATGFLIADKCKAASELAEAVGDSKQGGKGKSAEWRNGRADRMSSGKADMLRVNAALARLAALRRAVNAQAQPPKREPLPLNKIELHNIAMHFVAECERRLNADEMRRTWEAALINAADRSKFNSRYLSYFMTDLRVAELLK